MNHYVSAVQYNYKIVERESRNNIISRVHNRKREESIAVAYHPCAKFSGGQVGANMHALRACERQSG